MDKESPNLELLEHTLLECTKYVKKYVEGGISLSLFHSHMKKVLIPCYNNNIIRNDADKAKWELLDKFRGSIFDKGGDKFESMESPFPRRSDWIYGETNEEYSWVDQEKLKSMLKKEFLNHSKCASAFGIFMHSIRKFFAMLPSHFLSKEQPSARDVICEMVSILAPDDKTLLSEVLLAYKQPKDYFNRFTEELSQRGIEDSSDVDYWLALIDGMGRRKILRDIDWQLSGEDLAWNLNQLEITKNKNLNWKQIDDLGDRYQPTAMFADEVAHILTPEKLTAIFLPYEGDSYAITVTHNVHIQRLQNLARKLSKRIEIFDKAAGDK